MAGAGRTWAYTLYAGAGDHAPFVHALDTVGLHLTLGGGGRELVVTGGDGPLAVVDTATFQVRAPGVAAVRATATREAPGRPVPWIALAVAGSVLAATVGAWRRRSSTSQT
jgi:hypothetical protein